MSSEAGPSRAGPARLRNVPAVYHDQFRRVLALGTVHQVGREAGFASTFSHARKAESVPPQLQYLRVTESR
jgi:hypothetical protein